MTRTPQQQVLPEGALSAADSRWLHDTVRALRHAGEMLQDQLTASRAENRALHAANDRLEAEAVEWERRYRVEVETRKALLREANTR